MRKQYFELNGRAVTLYTDDEPQILFKDSEKRTSRAFCWIAEQEK